MLYQRDVKFSSFEEFNSFSHGWDVEFSTTTPRHYSAALRQSRAPGLLVNTVALSSPTLQRGTAPEGMRTFALPSRMPNRCNWRGLPVNQRTLLVFPEDRELFSTMGAAAEMMTVSLDYRLVDSTLEKWGLEADTVFNAPRTAQLSQAQHDAFHRNLALVTEFMVEYGDHRAFPHLSRGVQEYLLETLLQPMLDLLEQPNVSESAAAQRVKKATDYILCHLREPLAVADICNHVSCSRRSLEQSFRTHAGTSPKQFIQIMRLEVCRKLMATRMFYFML